jgi:hypothetical protein
MVWTLGDCPIVQAPVNSRMPILVYSRLLLQSFIDGSIGPTVILEVLGAVWFSCPRAPDDSSLESCLNTSRYSGWDQLGTRTPLFNGLIR